MLTSFLIHLDFHLDLDLHQGLPSATSARSSAVVTGLYVSKISYV